MAHELYNEGEGLKCRVLKGNLRQEYEDHHSHEQEDPKKRSEGPKEQDSHKKYATYGYQQHRVPPVRYHRRKQRPGGAMFRH